MNHKLYAVSIADIALIGFSIFAEIEFELRVVGLLIGLVVGVLTVLKLVTDLKIRRIEHKMKNIELRRKEEEERLFFQEKFVN